MKKFYYIYKSRDDNNTVYCFLNRETNDLSEFLELVSRWNQHSNAYIYKYIPTECVRKIIPPSELPTMTKLQYTIINLLWPIS